MLIVAVVGGTRPQPQRRLPPQIPIPADVEKPLPRALTNYVRIVRASRFALPSRPIPSTIEARENCVREGPLMISLQLPSTPTSHRDGSPENCVGTRRVFAVDVADSRAQSRCVHLPSTDSHVLRTPVAMTTQSRADSLATPPNSWRVSCSHTPQACGASYCCLWPSN